MTTFLCEIALFLLAAARRIWRNKTVAIATVLTGGEAVVQLGIYELPGSQDIDPRLRVLLIFALIGAAYYFRWKAQKELEDGR